MSAVASGLLALVGIASVAEPVIVRAAVHPDRPVWIGERASVFVTVLMSERPDHSPRFDLAPVDGALFVQAPGSPLLGTERVEGSEYSSQRFELMLFAQREGELHVPPVSVRATLGGVDHRVTTEPLSVHAVRPDGVAPEAALITTRELTIDQRWDPEPRDAAVGDAFVRTITIRARDLMGLAIPPAPAPASAGVAVYAGEPVVDDRLERGALTSTRTDTVTLVCERSGPVVIPELVYRYWNPDAKRLEEQRLSGISFEVAAPPRFDEDEPADRPIADPVIAWLAGVAVVLVAVLGLARRAIARAWTEASERRREREDAYFRRLLAACKTGDPVRTWGALVAWVDRRSHGRTVSVREFASRSGHPDLVQHVDDLQRAMLAPDRAWSSVRLAEALGRMRRSAHRARTRASGLPPVNPRFERG